MGETVKMAGQVPFLDCKQNSVLSLMTLDAE